MKKREVIQKRTAVVLVTAYILALVPVLLLGCYNYPCADDFGFSACSHIAWKESHSLWEVLKAACRTVSERYFTWQGTFFSVFVMALQPGLFAEEGYRFVPWIMIGAMTVSTMFFLYVVLVRALKAEKTLFISISMLFLLFALECMIDKIQAFFWFNGAAHYMIPYSAALVLLGLLIWMLTEEKPGIGKMTAACMAAVCVGGGNYISGLTILLVIAAMYAVLFYFREGERMKRLILPTVIYIAAFVANMAAPGNMVRQAEIAERPGVIKSILLSFFYCTEFFTEIWVDWTFLAFLLLMIPFALDVIKTVGERFDYPFPLLVPFLSYCLLATMFTPSLFAMGIPGGGRIYNIIYLAYLMLVILNLVYLLGWLHRFLEEHGSKTSEKSSSVMKWYTAAVLFWTLFNAAMYSKADTDFFTSVSALKSLVSGEASAYAEQAKERNTLLNDDSLKDVELKEFTVKPKLLFLDDIDWNADDWRKVLLCRYYEKDSVKLIKRESETE